jgi:5'(3')-deoxyribonucleotidase
MRLGIDLDGVVADFNGGWTRIYNKDFGARVSPEAVKTWDGLHELTHFPDMMAFWQWAEGGDRASIFRHLETYVDAVPSLELLSRDHEIVIITTKPSWAVHDTFAWIAEHHIPTREVHVTRRKWRVACDVYLDDAPHQLRLLRQRRMAATICRFIRPWNDPVPGVVDVASWEEFVALVNGLGD